MQIEIASNERVFTAGKTGSGKTYLNRELCRSVSRLVVLDPKGTLRDDDEDKPADELWHLEEWSERARRKLDEGKPVRVRVPAPLRDSARGGAWDSILWSVYDAGNCVLEIDEMYGVVPPNSRLPDSLNAIYTRGRELGIGVYACTQRPVWVPLQAKSEADWFFCFRLMLADDRRAMSEIMGPDVIDPIPETDEHGFWTFNAAWRVPEYTSELVANPRGREAA